MAVLAYDTGIAPNDLMDTSTDILAEMVAYRAEIAKAVRKQRAG